MADARFTTMFLATIFLVMRRAKRVRARFPAIALAAIAGVAALTLPAHAQLFGDHWGFGQPDRRPAPSSHGFFSFPFFGRPFLEPFRGPANAPPAESVRAPPPRKQQTPPTTTVAVIGDSMADWLAYGLEEVYADQPRIGIVRNVRPYSGLIHYEPRNDTLEWSQAVKDVLATEKPSAIVVMLGLNDRVALHVPAAAPTANQAAPQQTQNGKPAPKPAEPPAAKTEAATDAQHPAALVTYEFHTDEWAKLYAKRIDDMIAVLKSSGVPVIWVGLPAIRGPKATADMNYLDDLYHTEADKAGITYVDIWDGFVDENGRYSVEGPDFEGQTRRLRTGDGVHFTKFGALKLAHLVDQELGRVLANPAVPVALPSPQAAAPATPGAARPAVGPVLPLTGAGGVPGNALNSEDGGLLGSGSHPAPISSENPTAASVLLRGDPLKAPAGRADDFAWTPQDETANAARPAAAQAPQPALPKPAPHP